MFDVVESNDDDRQVDDRDDGNDGDDDDHHDLGNDYVPAQARVRAYDHYVVADYGEHDDYYENLNKKHKQNMKQRLVELMESYLNMKMKKKTYLNSCLFYSIVDYLIQLNQ